MINEKDIQYQASRARIAILARHPFYGHILTRMRFEFVEGAGITATDGESIFIFPSFGALSLEEQISALVHEVLHALDGHIWRTGKRDAWWANVAQDVFIHHVLEKERLATVRENARTLREILQARGGHLISDFKGQFWEQIYEVIKDQRPGQGTLNCYRPAKAGHDETFRQWVRQAAMYAQQAGQAPGPWQEFVEAAMPKVPLETKLFEFLQRGIGSEQSWAACNRRWVYTDTYLPVELEYTMGETVVVVDTSGSRSNDDLRHALGIIVQWREEHPCKLHLVECDYAIPQGGWRTFEREEPLPWEYRFHGRGGTSFAPPFQQVAARNIQPAMLIYITDGLGSTRGLDRPSYPVLWVLTGSRRHGGFNPPFGEVVHID